MPSVRAGCDPAGQVGGWPAAGMGPEEGPLHGSWPALTRRALPSMSAGQTPGLGLPVQLGRVSLHPWLPSHWAAPDSLVGALLCLGNGLLSEPRGAKGSWLSRWLASPAS